MVKSLKLKFQRNFETEVIEYVAAEEAGILQSQDICHENEGAGVSGLRKSGYKRSDSQELPPEHAAIAETNLTDSRTLSKKGKTSAKPTIRNALPAADFTTSQACVGLRKVYPQQPLEITQQMKKIHSLWVGTMSGP